MIKRVGRYMRQHHLALLALFVALGGTSFAAASVVLPANSVGAKQLQKNAVVNKKIKNSAVTGAKVADNSLRGDDVLESSLGKVPSATNADHATSADSATNATNATNATSATSSANAGTVNGYAANGISRLAGAAGVGFVDHQVTTAYPSFEAIGSVTLEAPGKGFVLVTGVGTAYNDRSSCPCSIAVRLRDATNDVASPHTSEDVASAGHAPLNPTWVFPVSAAGSTTYELQIAYSGSAGVGVYNTGVSAVFSPFGPSGTNTSSTATRPTPRTLNP